jgi:hypothetical protein
MAISTFGSSQQRTGAPTVDYTSILPYMQMAKQVETDAHNQKIADKQAKRQEVAMKADEYRKSNQLRNQNEAVISAALQANPNLQEALNSAPEEVRKQWDKLQKGSGTLAGSSVVSAFLQSTEKQNALAMERQAATVEQQGLLMQRQAQMANARANQQKAVADMLTAQSKAAEGRNIVTEAELQSLQEDGLNFGYEFSGFNPKGEKLYKLEDFSEGKTLTQEEVTAALKKGIKYKGTMNDDGSLFATGFTTVESSSPLDRLGPAQKGALDTMGQEAGAWLALKNGGAIQAQGNLESYRDVINMLESGEISTGAPSDNFLSLIRFNSIDDTFRGIFNPNKQNAIEIVRGVVFQGLRETLGAQFTEKEARQLVEASYNPNLPSKNNIARLKRLADVLEATIIYKNSLSKRVLSGTVTEDILSGALLSPEEIYNGVKLQVLQEFKQEDRILGKSNPNESPVSPNDEGYYGEGIKVEFN